MKQKVSIIIPNWNGSNLLKVHLPSVLKSSDGAEIIVVDDGSTDDSTEVLRNRFPSVRIVQKDRHVGYAGTVNAGVAHANGDIVVLLNTDVEPEYNFLEYLTPHFQDERIFAVGCMDKSIESGDIVLRGRGVARWEKGFYVHARGEVDKRDTAWVSGGSGAFRKSLWEKLGGMDEMLSPFYWEDIDLSYRARRLGYKLVFESKSIVTHFHEKGKIQSEYSGYFVRRIAYKNQFIFAWKHMNGNNIFAHCFWTPVRLAQAILRGDFAMIIGYVHALLYLPKIIAYRIQWK